MRRIHFQTMNTKSKRFLLFMSPKGGIARSRLYSIIVYLCGVLFGIVLGTFAGSLFLGVYYGCSTKQVQKARAFDLINADKNKFPNNSDKNLVFVGILTAQSYLNSRVPTLFDTWVNDIPGDVAVFAKEEAVFSHSLPVFKLAGTDDSYPPQQKAFVMLKFMYDNYLDHYEFFFRADDDVYIRPDKLETFLRSVNSSKIQNIGQMGQGLPEDFGKLSFLDDENFCMGGPGMILSRETLAKIGPHISECLRNVFTTQEDVEVGRCIQRVTGVPCTWAYDVSTDTWIIEFCLNFMLF